VGLDDHRAAACQRRGGVAARHREGQREIAGAEYRDRTYRYMPLTQISARQRLAVRQRRVKPHIEPRTAPDDIGEQAKLADRTGALTLDPCARQSAFGHGAFDQLIAQFENLPSDGLKEPGPDFRRGLRICQPIDTAIITARRLPTITMMRPLNCSLVCHSWDAKIFPTPPLERMSLLSRVSGAPAKWSLEYVSSAANVSAIANRSSLF
jgi:hypothetical protein